MDEEILKKLLRLNAGDARDSEVLRNPIKVHINVLESFFIDGKQFRTMDEEEFNSPNSRGARSARILYWLGIKGIDNIQGIFKDKELHEIIYILKKARMRHEGINKLNYIINMFQISLLCSHKQEFKVLLEAYDNKYMKAIKSLDKISQKIKMTEPYKKFFEDRKKLEFILTKDDLIQLLKYLAGEESENSNYNDSYNLDYLLDLEKKIKDKQLVEVSKEEHEEYTPKTYINQEFNKRDYIAEQMKNIAVGFAAEQLVMKYEIDNLLKLNKKELAKKVEHVSVTKGDGLGYDILSYDKEGREIFIEVKGTESKSNSAFYVTQNEINVSMENSEKYYLYRVFNLLDDQPNIIKYKGSINENFNLKPNLYTANDFSK